MSENVPDPDVIANYEYTNDRVSLGPIMQRICNAAIPQTPALPASVQAALNWDASVEGLGSLTAPRQSPSANDTVEVR
jgi:hypothetical protein